MIEINIEKVSKMSQEELVKLVFDLDLEIHSLNTKLKINSSIQDSFENTFYSRMGKIANAQITEKINSMSDNERYDKAEKVKILLSKEWIGWHGAIHEAGKIMTVAKETCNYGNGIRYFDAPGMGYPSIDIENDCVEREIKNKKKWWKR